MEFIFSVKRSLELYDEWEVKTGATCQFRPLSNMRSGMYDRKKKKESIQTIQFYSCLKL